MGDALHTGGTSGGLGVTSAREARLAQAGLIAVQGPTALDPRTGVVIAPGVTTLVTSTSDTAPMAYNIAPHQWVTSRRSADGPYLGALDAVRKVTTTAAPASGSRIDVIWVRQSDNDPTVLTPDATTSDLYGVTQGTSSTGTPAKPALPVGAEELATATVNAGATSTAGAGVTITNTARLTTARGARIPVRNQTERDALTTYPGYPGVLRLDTGSAEDWDTAKGWRTVQYGPLPTIRVYRNGADAYGGGAFQAVPYDTVDSSQTINPGSAYFTAKLGAVERRVLLLQSGLYQVNQQCGFVTVAANYMRLAKMPDPGGANNPTDANALASVGPFGQAGSLTWTGRLAAGTHIGGAILYTGTTIVEGVSGYHNELVITRLSD